MGRTITYASLIAFSSLAALGQVATSPSVFEVASVRLNKTGVRGGSIEFSKGGERFTATNMPFGALILAAYNITVRQLTGLDGSLSDKYDVAAKADHAVRPEEMLRMLQALLVERFKLVIRRETKEVPVYALVLGKNGPKLHQGDDPEGATPRSPTHAGGTELGSGHLVFKDETMSDFAWALTKMAGIGDRVVVDNTGLKGSYDFELTFERYTAPPPVGGDAREAQTRLEGSSVFSSLQEQLGLKLEPTKAPVEFLVIDHVEKPTEN